ncbi:unnamed protein product [Fraxinus pennsylvanica]|uniref:J domain-containing protein n=1 Tax=Fraxinus pennsylvanica TaxID=56036 RepID=A0AAD2E4J9_9LAMI|nr:unnamed protein product [Fraxinus pennsylvanica]
MASKYQSPWDVESMIRIRLKSASGIGSRFDSLAEEDDDESFLEYLQWFLSPENISFLGVAANADFEEIKAAYPRLSKEYHPDTTELPLKAASEKFMKLQEICNVLNDDEKCKFYDWSLAASREAEKMSMKLEDLYMQDIENWESIPNMVK